MAAQLHVVTLFWSGTSKRVRGAVWVAVWPVHAPQSRVAVWPVHATWLSAPLLVAVKARSGRQCGQCTLPRAAVAVRPVHATWRSGHSRYRLRHVWERIYASSSGPQMRRPFASILVFAAGLLSGRLGWWRMRGSLGWYEPRRNNPLHPIGENTFPRVKRIGAWCRINQVVVATT